MERELQRDYFKIAGEGLSLNSDTGSCYLIEIIYPYSKEVNPFMSYGLARKDELSEVNVNFVFV